MLKITCPPSAEFERRYVFDVVFRDYLGLDYVVTVAPGSYTTLQLLESPGKRKIEIADKFLPMADRKWLSEDSLPNGSAKNLRVTNIVGHQHLKETVPAFFREESRAEVAVVATQTSLRIQIDIFGLIFFMLSRYEEAVIPARDEHRRFPSDRHLAVRTGLHHRAIVNEYLELLWAALISQWPSLKRAERRYHLEISHDVDEPFSTLRCSPLSIARDAAADLLKRRSLGLTISRCRSYLDARRGGFQHDPANTFPFIMDLSERLGMQSTFNFLSGRTSSSYDARYELTDVPVELLLQSISRRGHLIGYHASYFSGDCPEVLAAEVDRLKDACRRSGIHQTTLGGRQHFLRWRNPITWQAWDAAHLDFDSTLGFADLAGFRCGTCYEYPVYDLQKRHALRLRERPLIVMDIGLLREAEWNHSKGLDVLSKLAAECRRYNGSFTLLWHNTCLLTQAEKRLYSTVLQILEAA